MTTTAVGNWGVAPPGAVPTGDGGPPQQLLPEDAVGGEVRVGHGPAPAFLRWFNYSVFVASILYLVVFWPDTGYHPVVPVFAALLSLWLVYIFVAKKPAEP